MLHLASEVLAILSLSSSSSSASSAFPISSLSSRVQRECNSSHSLRGLLHFHERDHSRCSISQRRRRFLVPCTSLLHLLTNIPPLPPPPDSSSSTSSSSSSSFFRRNEETNVIGLLEAATSMNESMVCGSVYRRGTYFGILYGPSPHHSFLSLSHYLSPFTSFLRHFSFTPSL